MHVAMFFFSFRSRSLLRNLWLVRCSAIMKFSLARSLSLYINYAGRIIKISPTFEIYHELAPLKLNHTLFHLFLSISIQRDRLRIKKTKLKQLK